MKIVKAPRYSILHKPFMQRERVELIVTMFQFLPFQNSNEPMLEHEAWPVIAELLGDLPIDTTDYKATGEWLAWGNACAPKGTEVSELDVRIMCSEKEKILRIYGERQWIAPRGRSITITEAKPFEEMPIKPERAFGGPKFKDNPLGVGHWPRWKSLDWYPLPSVTYPDNDMQEPKEVIKPAYFGPRDIMLPERQKFAGTYDREWAETSFPGLPDDFDDRFYQVAQEDQHLEDYFKGNETFSIENMHPDNRLQTFTLPGIRPRSFVSIKRGGNDPSFEEVPMHTDTIWLFPNIEVAITVHRGKLLAEAMDLKEVEVLMGAFEWQKDAPRPLDYYRECMDERTNMDTVADAFTRPADLYPEKWEEPPERLLEIIKPRDPTITKSEIPKVDAMWAKWKGILEAGLASQGLGSYEEFMEKVSGFDEDPDLVNIRKEIEKLKAVSPKTPQEAAATMAQGKKVDVMINAYLQFQTDAADAHFKKEAANFGYDYNEMKAAAASSLVSSPKAISTFVNAELNRIVNDTEKPQSVREAAKSAITGISQVDHNEITEKLSELESIQKSKLGHLLPVASPLTPANNEDLCEVLKFAKENNIETKGRNCRGADLSGLDLSKMFLEEADFTSASLRGTIFDESMLKNACFAHADLTGASLKYCHLGEANFGETILDGANFYASLISDASFAKTQALEADFSMSQLQRSIFMEVNFKSVNFTLCDLGEARFIESNIEGGRFLNTEVEQLAFIDCQARKSIFFEAKGKLFLLIGGDLSDTDFSRAELESFSLVNNTCLDRCKFRESKFYRGNFRGASLINSNFSNSDFTESDLSETNLTDSNFFKGYLQKVRFHRARLENIDFTGADLMEANFLLADMRNCSVKDANFFAADFMKTTFKDVDFTEANIKRTRLEGFRF